jgi:hypothetical protein
VAQVVVRLLCRREALASIQPKREKENMPTLVMKEFWRHLVVGSKVISKNEAKFLPRNYKKQALNFFL